jgi:hypothetical protein
MTITSITIFDIPDLTEVTSTILVTSSETVVEDTDAQWQVHDLTENQVYEVRVMVAIGDQALEGIAYIKGD